ncbi:hypothetical protein ACWCPL_22060, partial [Streptomyces sp. NPDC001948]
VGVGLVGIECVVLRTARRCGDRLLVLLAGEVGHAGGDALAGRVEERLTLMSPLRTEVRAGRLGGAAVLRGALLAARDAAQDELFTPAG